jgi:3-hydroxyacyl-CoA dehydrogenase
MWRIKMLFKSVAIIGSGVMGSGIAAHCANAGLDVVLLDIVPKGAIDRNELGLNALKNIKDSNPEMLMNKEFINRIKIGNIDDDMQLLSSVDWIIEVVVERIDVKHNVYENIAKYRKKGSLVSSNTSTIPRNQLVEGMDEEMASCFIITHFFNPPRYLTLLEVVGGKEVSSTLVSDFINFADINLGKDVVVCNDTPGFIGNRLGVYHIQRSINCAIDLELTIEETDAMLGRPIGHPKTGVFGLMDLVGIDLIPHIFSSMLDHLSETDPLRQQIRNQELITEMISNGWVGRKGKGGFYRLNKETGTGVKEARNLKTGEYNPVNRKAEFPSAKRGKKGLSALVSAEDKGAKLVREVLIDTLSYACQLIPEVTSDINSIDIAMKVGYSWKKGPFEMIDELSSNWLINELEKKEKTIPDFLKLARDSKFYKEQDGSLFGLNTDGKYSIVDRPIEKISIVDLKRKGEPIKRNGSASLWDFGDEILLVEYHSKMNTVDPTILEMLLSAVQLAEEGHWKGIVIGNDGKNFCAGANLGLALFAANLGAWAEVEQFVQSGQDAYMALKYCTIPVVSAATGLCLGGGCEVLMHSDAVQAHSESYIGLVEVGVGIIPAWGGCKELISRLSQNGRATKGPMGAVMKAFEIIGTAKVAKSAHQAQEIGYLSKSDKITMNRSRLLYDAKITCLDLATNYIPPEPPIFELPGPSGKAALDLAVADMLLSGIATPHDVVVADVLATILSGGNTSHLHQMNVEDILYLEREGIIKLSKNVNSMDRMEHMLVNGKPLRN